MNYQTVIPDLNTEKNEIYRFSISFSFQSFYKGLHIPNEWVIEKGLGTRICDVIWLESQFYENLNDVLIIQVRFA